MRGALIPALTLGIPGSGAAAVLSGSLTVQGFAPGHDLFNKYGSITYAILIGFLLANILMGIFGFLDCKKGGKAGSHASGDPSSRYYAAVSHWFICNQKQCI